MAHYAYRDLSCADCADLIQQGEPIYFNEGGGKLCLDCGQRDHLVCDCGGQKKPQYNTCYVCSGKSDGKGSSPGASRLPPVKSTDHVYKKVVVKLKRK